MNIISVVGARPNFMKIAPIYRVLEEKRKNLEVKNDSAKTKTFFQPPTIIHKICHTGQHYDDQMSGVFLKSLDYQNLIFIWASVAALTQNKQLEL